MSEKWGNYGISGLIGGAAVFFTMVSFSFYFFRFYLLIHETHTERQRHRQKEKQAPCREGDTGFDPRTPGSQPEPKADTQSLSHPGVPIYIIF